LEDWDKDANYEDGSKEKARLEETSRLMTKVPGLKQKIARKSAHIASRSKKFVARITPRKVLRKLVLFGLGTGQRWTPNEILGIEYEKEKDGVTKKRKGGEQERGRESSLARRR